MRRKSPAGTLIAIFTNRWSSRGLLAFDGAALLFNGLGMLDIIGTDKYYRNHTTVLPGMVLGAFYRRRGTEAIEKNIKHNIASKYQQWFVRDRFFSFSIPGAELARAYP